MSDWTAAAMWVAATYLVSAIPVGLLLARARGIDLRAVGSGNIGATNAVRALGARWGAVVFVLDALKALIPVALARAYFSQAPADVATWAPLLVCYAAVLGHIFPVYLRFRGGKGVACAFGGFAALDPWVALAGIVLYGQVLWLTRTSAVGSLTAVTSLTLTVLVAPRPWSLRILVLAIAVLIWLRHLENLQQVLAVARARRTPSTSASPPSFGAAAQSEVESGKER